MPEAYASEAVRLGDPWPFKGRVVYEPVSIEPRTLVPKIIRDDNRYKPDLEDG